jgi:hypothetical protein
MKQGPVGRGANSRARRVLLIGFTATAFLAVPAVAGATEFVDPAGTDSGDCSTLATACEHIQQAIDNAAVGETVSVAAGTYNDEPGDQVHVNKGLRLEGAGIGLTIIDADTAHGAGTLDIQTTTADPITVTGLTVRGDGTYGVFLKNGPPGGATYTLDSVRLEGQGAGGSDFNLYSYNDHSNLVVQNSELTGADFNPILVERHVGGTDFNGNAITKSAGTAGSTTYFNFNPPEAGLAPISGPARFRNNTVVTNGNGGASFNAGFGGASVGGYSSIEVSGNSFSGFGNASAGISIHNDGPNPGTGTLIGAATVNNNSLVGPGGASTGTGVRFRGLTSNVTANGNQVLSFARGFQFTDASGAPTHAPGPSDVHFNRIVDNATAQLDHVAGGPVDAENNWWGCNEGPNANAADCGTVTGTADFDPWVVLGLSAAPTSIQTGGQSSQITADLSRNSDGNSVPGLFAEGVPVTFATTLGTITSPVATQASRAISTLTSGATAGTADITAGIDNETQTTAVTITEPPASGGGGVLGDVSGIEGACDNRMTGTGNSDNLKGTNGGDRILGYAGDDVVRSRGSFDCLKGNKGDDRLFPGLAGDIVQAGPGDDFTNARDGKRDKVNCGAGDDVVKVDQFDVARNCEQVAVRLRFAG